MVLTDLKKGSVWFTAHQAFHLGNGGIISRYSLVRVGRLQKSENQNPERSKSRTSKSRMFKSLNVQNPECSKSRKSES
uniref:Uncharacterized protein n=1 Tax=Trichuris muris TaxID=70415 RepID=A0A5S6QBZ3_TRIMR